MELIRKDISPIEAMERRLRKKAKVVAALKNFPEGQEFLDILNEEFAHKDLMVKGDVHATYANMGARDLLDYINQLINYGESKR